MQCDQYECASCANHPPVQRGSNVFSFFFPQHEAGFTSRRRAIFDPAIYSTLAFLILKNPLWLSGARFHHVQS
jgi:hypothetical protein